jgi:hypothetical protein
MMKTLLFPALLVLSSIPAYAAECAAQSGAQRVALLELYTSEGCSSCPPADAWFSQLEKRGFGADKVIPIALHVDYWDYIGWKDRFASPVHTARQHGQAALNRSNIVYTPQLMLNGRDYRGWGNLANFSADIAAVNRSAPRADIKLSANSDSVQLAVKVNAHGTTKSALYLALVESGLSSDVKAGENSGARLYHDFVVRSWHGPFALENGGLELQRRIAAKPEWKIANSRLVAFVQEPNGEIAQTLALPLCPTP